MTATAGGPNCPAERWLQPAPQGRQSQAPLHISRGAIGRVAPAARTLEGLQTHAAGNQTKWEAPTARRRSRRQQFSSICRWPGAVLDRHLGRDRRPRTPGAAAHPFGILLGLTTAARYAPILLLSPYAGLLIDRFNKRRVLLVTQVGLGGVALLFGLVVLSGEVRLWQVVVLALAFGTFSAADNPARQAFVSELVDQPLLRNAVILNSILVNIARVIGPTIAAFVIHAAGIGWCFMINAAAFSPSSAHCSSSTPISYIQPPRPRGVQVRSGMAFGMPLGSRRSSARSYDGAGRNLRLRVRSQLPVAGP